MFDYEALKRGVINYGGLGARVVDGRVINADAACEHCMSEAMKKCADKPRAQQEAIAISECKDKCPTQPKNDDNTSTPPEPVDQPSPISGGS